MKEPTAVRGFVAVRHQLDLNAFPKAQQDRGPGGRYPGTTRVSMAALSDGINCLLFAITYAVGNCRKSGTNVGFFRSRQRCRVYPFLKRRKFHPNRNYLLQAIYRIDKSFVTIPTNWLEKLETTNIRRFQVSPVDK